MRLLDLFCGAGGCSTGYSWAGFDEIVGVDNRSQPRYPFRFIHEDVFSFLDSENLNEFDLIHASPPCQLFSFGTVGKKDNHYDLLTPIRQVLEDRAVDYVIENVIGAPMISPITLDGIMFGLKLIRKRLFETNWPLEQPPIVKTNLRVHKHELCSVAGHGGHGPRNMHSWCLAMGISWMNEKELTQAIPPLYTQYIGREYIAYKA